MPLLMPIGGGGSIAWSLVEDIDLGGSGGAVSPGGTITCSGFTGTFRRSGTQATLTQAAGGVQIGYAGPGNAHWSLDFALSSVVPDWTPDTDPLIALAIISGVPAGASTCGCGIWADSAGTMSWLVGGGRRVSDIFAQTLLNRTSAIQFDPAAFGPANPATVGALIVPRLGACGLGHATGSPPADPISPIVHASAAWGGINVPSNWNTIGLSGYMDASPTGTLLVENLLVYRQVVA